MPHQPHGLLPACLLAGGPADNETFFCEGTNTWCFSHNSTAGSFGDHQAACKAGGGNLVMYDSPAMQLLVEKVFSTLTDYWVGLKRESGKPYVFTTGVAAALAKCSSWAGCALCCAADTPLCSAPACQATR